MTVSFDPVANILLNALQRGLVRFTNLLLPAHDAGLWNYVFAPAPNQTLPKDPHLLRLASQTEPGALKSMLQSILIEPQNNLNVFAWVTRSESEQALARVLTQPRQLIFVWICLTLILLMTFVLSVATLTIACCCWQEQCSCCLCCVHLKKKTHTRIYVSSKTGNETNAGSGFQKKKVMNKPPAYLSENYVHTLSIGSVRAALHTPGVEESVARTVETRIPRITRNRGQSPDCNRHWNLGLSNRISPHRTDSIDTLPLGSEACSCPIPMELLDYSENEHQNGFIRSTQSTVNKTAKHIHNSLLALNWIFIALLIFCEILVGYALEHVHQYANTSDNPPGRRTNLQQFINITISELVSFLLDTVSQGEVDTAATLEVLQGQVTNQLNTTAQSVMDQLLKAYQIAQLFTSVDQLKPRVESLIQNTAYVRANHESVKAQLSAYSGELNAYKDLLVRALRELCAQFPGSNHQVVCLKYQASAEQLQFSFDPTRVNPDPSIALHVLMQQFNFNLTQIMTSFDSAQAGIDRMTQEVIQKIQSKFRLEAFLGDFLSIWKRFNSSVAAPLINEINAAKPLVTFYSSFICSLVDIGAYVVLVLLLLILLSQISCLLFCLADSIDRKLYSPSGIVSVNSGTHPILINTKTTQCEKSSTWPIEVRVYVQHVLGRTHIRLRPISVVCGLFSLVLCIELIVSSLFLPGAMLVQSELCRNFAGESGRALTDTILYRFMQHEWNRWLNNATVPPDILSLINIGPPNNLTAVISYSCNPALKPNDYSVGLLGLVGHERSVNFHTLLASDRVKKIITDSENEFVKQIVQTNFASYIPSNLDSLYSMALNLTTYLDSAAYNDSYKELNGPMLSVPSLPAFVQTIYEFLRKLPVSVHVQTVSNALKLIEQSVPTLNRVVEDARKIAKAFKNLAENQNLTIYFETIFKNVQAMSKIILNKAELEAPIRPAFQRSINQFLTEMNQLLILYINRYLDMLIPCGRLYQTYHLIYATTCEPDGFPNGIGLLSLLLVITTFVLIIDLFLFVRFNARHQTQSHLMEHHLNWTKAVKWTFDEWQKQIHRN